MRTMKYIFWIFFLCAFQMAAQDQILPISDVEVIKAFEAKLKEAKMLNVAPEIKDPKPDNTVYSYLLDIEPLKLNYPDPKIRPLAYSENEESHIHYNWIKLGFGTLKRPSAQLGHFNFLEDKYRWSVFADYHDGIFKDSLFSRNINLKANGEYYINEDLELRTDVFYNNQYRSTFPFSDAQIISDQVYSSTGLALGLHSHKRFKDIFEFGLDLEFLNNAMDRDPYEVFPNIEPNFKEVRFAMPLYVYAHLSESTLLSARYKVEYFKISDTNAFFSNQVMAKIHSQLNDFHIDAGVHLAVASEESKLFPILSLQYRPQESAVSIFIKSSMDVQINGLAHLYSRNHFLQSPVTDDDERLYTDCSVDGGVSYSTSKLNASISGGYHFYKNISDFVFVGRYFDSRFTNGTGVGLIGSFEYALNANLLVKFEGEKIFYSLDNPFGLPDVDLTASLIFKEGTKYRIVPKVNYRNAAEILLLAPTNSDFDTNALFDVSVYADYYITDHMGLYLEANNLLNQRYTRWVGQPDFGTNVYGGIKVKF